MTDGTRLAERLRAAREQAGLSQGQVAKLMKTHRPTISEIESGRRRVQAEELSTFAKLYHVTTQWLLAEDDTDSDADTAKIQLAARELAKLKKEDLDRVLGLLTQLRAGGPVAKGRKKE